MQTHAITIQPISFGPNKGSSINPKKGIQAYPPESGILVYAVQLEKQPKKDIFEKQTDKD